ncbi:MAG: cytidine deaminase [Dethiobacter sp.]|nr:cytidine deaminase [Dethiobacter sp.]MBS3899265.1 cytidine deaminase [Dethiobacter sp.]
MEMLEELLASARKAWEQAYCPYSRFPVGAALLTSDGEIFIGCNVENLSFGLTVCAERTALCSAVAAGKRQFSGMVVVTDTQEPETPCGACRQALYEFSPNLWIVTANLQGQQRVYRLCELLPAAFQAKI